MTAYSDLFEKLFYMFRDDPHTLSLLTVIADPIQDTLDAMTFIKGASSIDTATGAQLDQLAGRIGLTRPPAQENPENIFSLKGLGEFDDLDGSKSLKDDTDTVETGGYLTTLEGLESISDPGADMTDADFRYLIRQKAAVIRSKMTRANLFNYLIAFGGRVKIDDDTRYIAELDPYSYYDLDGWEKWYVVNKGFAPAAITVQFRDNIRDEASI